MGAYAACAFASLAPGSTVVAFSPQSTLAPGMSDWDARYPTGTNADWTGPFSDAADSLKNVGKAWIVYDPRVPQDKMHAERLAGPNVSLLKARYSSHFTAQYLRQIGMLKTFVLESASGEMTDTRFYQLYRSARNYRRYLGGVVQQVNQHANPALRLRCAEALRNANMPGLAKSVTDTLEERALSEA